MKRSPVTYPPDALDQYLADTREWRKAHAARNADILEKTVSAGSRDANGNSVEALVSALRKASK